MAERRRDDGTLVMRDLVDGQLESADGLQIGRVDDALLTVGADGSVVVSHLLSGPEALAGRFSTRLRPLAAAVFGGRFEHAIAMDEVGEIGPSIQLWGNREEYAVGRTDRWFAERVLRFIPGSGR